MTFRRNHLAHFYRFFQDIHQFHAIFSLLSLKLNQANVSQKGSNRMFEIK